MRSETALSVSEWVNAVNKQLNASIHLWPAGLHRAWYAFAVHPFWTRRAIQVNDKQALAC
jgi:hypothetical protein